MPYLVLADMLVAIHITFVLFVVLGGFLVFRWRRLAWLHLPAALWGAFIEVTGWICPLTPLENRLREMGGGTGYGTSFIEHYILPILYPEELTRNSQILLGICVVALNLGIYTWILFRFRRNGG
jgi:hypothetical protein